MSGGTWLTRAQAAKVVGVDPTTLWRWAVAGEVPSPAILRTGKKMRYLRSWCEMGILSAVSA